MKIATWMCALICAAAVPASAIDRYEGHVGGNFDDDSSATFVELLHGRIQVHDLEAAGVADQDWTFVQETPGHSYEVTVHNTALIWTSDPGSSFIRMNRVNASGAVLTAGAPTNVFAGSFAVRWMATPIAGPFSFVQVVGVPVIPGTAAYEIEMRDTTYTLPRWNNTSSQFTVLLVQNTTNKEVTGAVTFYGPDGSVVHRQPLVLPPHGLHVLNTSTLAALQNLAGSAAIAHTGAYGALAGKAVALEPGTGFTFDTPITPIPY